MKKQWHNWTGNYSSRPEIVYPESEEDILRIFEKAVQSKKKVRVTGSGHSFTALCVTDDILISLDKMSGLVSVDAGTARARVKAGTQLHHLSALLFQQGLALENMGDIDVQSVAGALSTGTHGTGLQFGILATQVTAIRMVTPAGSIVECTAMDNEELFRAAQVSLGALGIITEYTLQCCPVYKLHYVAKRERLDEVLSAIDSYTATHRNFEFYWFPYTDKVQIKCSNHTDEEINTPSSFQTGIDDFLENEAFGLLCRVARLVPSFAFPLNRIAAALISSADKTDWSHNVYATRRRVRFIEMEYNIPRQAFTDVKKELVKLVNRKQYRVAFPIENRFVKSDSIFLSPAYERQSAYIAVHQYRSMAYEDYFRAVEAIMLAHGGRPHWGKMHFRKSADFGNMYPQWNHFLTIRKQCDPHDVLLNEYLTAIFHS